MVNQTWVNAGDFRVGDVLVTLDGLPIVIERIYREHLETPEPTYNFEVEDFHTYYVGDQEFLVHNKCEGNWAEGGEGTGANNAKKHFKKHGAEVGATTVEEYTKKAKNFANTVLNHRKKLKTAVIGGYTPDTVRYYYNGKYVDLSFNGVEHLLVSFGKQ